jgi:hypothetical protein
MDDCEARSKAYIERRPYTLTKSSGSETCLSEDNLSFQNAYASAPEVTKAVHDLKIAQPRNGNAFEDELFEKY